MPFTQSEGARIYWEESGSGEPVLLIMGLGYAPQMWFRTRPVMESQYRTVVFDNRGVGQSDVPAGAYTIAQMADDAAAVLDAAGILQARVFGISMGGMIAQELALRHPLRVGRLVLGCTTFGGKTAKIADEKVLEILRARATMTPEEGAEAMVPYIYDAGTPRKRIDEDLVARGRAYFYDGSAGQGACLDFGVSPMSECALVDGMGFTAKFTISRSRPGVVRNAAPVIKNLGRALVRADWG